MMPALKLYDNEQERDSAVSRQVLLKTSGGGISFAGGALHYLKRLIPWLVGAALLCYLVWSIDFYSLVGALSRAHVYLYATALLAFMAVNFMADSQNLHAILKLADDGMSFGDSMVIRGASYLLMIVDYTLGLSSIAYYLKKFKSIPILRGMGLMFILNYTTQVSLLLMAALGCLLAAGSPSPWFRQIAAICASLLAFCILFVVAIKHLPEWSFLKKLKKSDFIQVYIESSLKTYMINVTYRCGFYFTFIVFFYVGVRAFNMDIPFRALLVYVPVILLIISIPISAFGLGTSQAAMLVLFKDYGTPAQILAFSLAYSASMILMRGAIGTLFYSIITKRVSYKYKARSLRGELS